MLSGVSRNRWYSAGSWAMMARPAAPMRSGMRAPLDSPRSIKGRPRWLATCFTCLIFFMLTSNFVVQSGIKVHLPNAISSEVVRSENVVVTLTGTNDGKSPRYFGNPRKAAEKLGWRPEVYWGGIAERMVAG